MRKTFAALVAAMLGITTYAQADVITLTDGDIINGTVTAVADGKMTVHSDIMGDVVIPLDHVRTFSTNAPIELHLADGTIIKESVAASDSGNVELSGTGMIGAQKIAVANIDSINPHPLTGSFRLGGSLIRGNSFADNLTAGADLGYKLNKDSIALTAEYDYGKTKDRTTGITTTSTDRWEIDTQYRHNWNKYFYGYLEADETKDRVAFLDLRFTPSAGLGYEWSRAAALSFTTEAGVAWLYENYDNGTPTKEQVALKLAYHLKYDFNPKVSVFHDLTYFPSLERGSDYLLQADAGVHAKLTKNIFAELKIEWDYDAEPAIGALKNDARYVASLGYAL